MNGSRFRRSCTAALIATVGLLGAAPGAQAAVAAGADVNFPTTATVGQSDVPGTLVLRNQNTAPDDATANRVCGAGDPVPCSPGGLGIVLIPSCGNPNAAGCPPAQRDPGVFRVDPTATGRAGTACAGISFTVMEIDAATGRVRFVPGTPVTIPAGGVCRIDFTFDVLRVPTVDSDPTAAGVQTRQVTEHDQVLTIGGTTGASARGTSTTTVAAASPAITTQATPTATLGQPISDTATITVPDGAPPATGTVTFTVFGPDNATCTGAPSFTSGPQPVSNGSATSGPYTPTATGTYRWIATYSGDANYTPVTSPCNAPNETSTVTAAPAPAITVAKDASPTSRPAPGGTFTFTVGVTNSGPVPVTIAAITDDIYGNLATRTGSTCGALIGTTLAAGASSPTCSFPGDFTGPAGSTQTDTVTVAATDANGTTVTDTDTATVTITAAPVPEVDCGGAPPPGAIVGTRRDDELEGTSGDDVIFGLGGDDEIEGRGGDDVICAGGGEDEVEGGGGDDVIDGGGDEDELGGGAGDDVIDGGGDDDRIWGDGGDDELDGQGGDDRVSGGNGDDTVRGGAGSDDLYGGAGADELRGGGGRDELSGGRGADTLDGGAQRDECDGGSGTDTGTSCEDSDRIP